MDISFRRIVVRYVCILLMIVVLLPVVAAYAGTPGESSGKGSSTITVNGLTLNYYWNSAYIKNGGSQHNNNGGAYVTPNGTTLNLGALNSTYTPRSWSNIIPEYARDTKVWVTFKNLDAQERTLRITYTSTDVSSPNSTATSDTIDLAYGECFPSNLNDSGEASDGFYVLKDVNYDSTDDQYATGSITITNIQVVQNPALSLYPSSNSSYTYQIGDDTVQAMAANGTPIEAREVEQGSSVTLTAAGTSAYSFYAWMSGGVVLSYENTYSFTMAKDMVIYPVFLRTDTPTDGPFSVNGTRYIFWKDACAAAAGSGATIIVVENHILPTTLEENGLHSSVAASSYSKYLSVTSSGCTYILPSGMKLLIPYTTDPANPESGDFDAKPTMTNPSDRLIITIEVGHYYLDNIKDMGPSVTLTIPANTTLRVDGQMNVNSRVYVASSGDTGCPNEKHGQVVLSSASSSLVVNGMLYCYGYIIGQGTVTANSGSTVYELFQVRDWRGGTVGSGWDAEGDKNFLLSQFYLQNIESRFVIRDGATVRAAFSTAVSNSLQQADTIFISKATFDSNGTLNGTGFFRTDGCKVIRVFDVDTQTICYDIQPDSSEAGSTGTVDLDKVEMSISALGVTVSMNTANHLMNINGNMSINVGAGCTAKAKYAFKMLPGSSLNVEAGATLEIEETGVFYIYDKNSFVFNTHNYGVSTSHVVKESEVGIDAVGLTFTSHTDADNSGTIGSVVRYSPSRGAPKAKSFPSASLNIDGTLICYENVFTTTGKIYSNGGTAAIAADVFTDPGKLITGSGVIINHTRSANAAAVLPVEDTIQSGTTVTHATVPHVPALALLAGVSTSTTDADDSLGAGTYYGLGETFGNYWYQYRVNVNGGLVDVTSGTETGNAAGVVAYVANSTTTNGSVSFVVTNLTNCSHLQVTASSTATLSDAYKLTGFTGDCTVTISHTIGENGLCTGCNVFPFYASNVRLGNNLDMMFAFPASAFNAHILKNCFVRITRTFSDNRTTETEDIPVSQWYHLDKGDGDGYYIVIYSKFAAKEMCDTITLTVYETIDGVEKAISAVCVDSIQNYAMRMLNKHASKDTLCKLIVDMLNYGAACQNHFGYGTDTLANEKLSAAQAAMATKDADVDLKVDDVTATQANKGTYVGANLIANSNIQFAIAVKNQSASATVSSVTYGFKGHKGNEPNGTVTLGQMTTGNGCYYFFLPEIVVADARSVINITVTLSDGTTESWSESVVAYVARNTNDSPVFLAFMKFADSAYNYLHGNEVVK